MLSRLSEKFTPEELFWLNLYLRSPLPYVKQLYQQLSICDITREDYHTSYYIDFSITQSVPIIDTPCRVPVFIDFCANANFPFLDSKRSKYYNNTGMIHLLDSSENLANRFFVEGGDTYYSAILHFHKGIVCEFEINNWNGYYIDHELSSRSNNFKKIFRYKVYDFYVKGASTTRRFTNYRNGWSFLYTGADSWFIPWS